MPRALASTPLALIELEGAGDHPSVGGRIGHSLARVVDARVKAVPRVVFHDFVGLNITRD